jgi:hypothetical protein
MPEWICMCQNKDCPRSQECYRFKAIPSEWQSYALFEEICFERNGYEMFISAEGREIKKNDGE